MHLVKTSVSFYDRAWLSNVPSNLIPETHLIKRIEIEWVDGRPPVSGTEYYEQLKILWASPVSGTVSETILSPYLCDVDSYTKYTGIDELLEHTDELTPVSMIHGDATFSNVIIRHGDDRPFLIDNGHHRGLCVQELDEAKMMQSYDGFEEVYKGIVRPKDELPFTPRRVHWLLLASHYVRLLRHVQRREALQFARKRIDEILKG